MYVTVCKHLVMGGSALKYVKLISAVEQEIYVSTNSYPEYAILSSIEVKFEIEYGKFGDTDGFNRGRSIISDWTYLLGKIDENSDWEILAWGY